MHIPIQAIRITQRHLGFAANQVDGRLGPGTEAALDRALAARRDELHPDHVAGILDRSRRRKLTAYVQLLAADHGIDAGKIDGFWGPQTDFAFDSLEYFEEHGELPRPWRDVALSPVNPHGWPLAREAELIAFYGEPGDESNLKLIDAPFPHRLSWDPGTTVRRLRVHKRVADSLTRVLQEVLGHYGAEQITALRLDLWGGGYNKRRKRGGSEWSTHAWGIALDYDPDRNRLAWGREHASFARPEYDRWWELWEEEGWVSLGRAANFDWMHVQAARRP